jgi:hypothetical protein
MPSSLVSGRREFLLGSGHAVAAGWLALQLPWLAAMQACARDDAAAGVPFKSFTAPEGRAMRAFAAQILPAEAGLLGAEDAGAVHFVDRAVGVHPYAELLPELKTGLAYLDERARVRGVAGGFADLSSEGQVAVMREVEHATFFASARMLVLAGTFADPSHGGNRDLAGWHLVGMMHGSSFQTPFGWYDDPSHRDTPPGVA